MAEKKKFLLRLDPVLHASLEKWAADELRSLNAHIEFLLLQAARRAGRVRGGAGDGEEPSPQEPPESWGV